MSEGKKMKDLIVLKSVPTITFAHIYTTRDKYINHLPKAVNFFELGYIKEGNSITWQGGEEFRSAPETISIQIRNDAVDVESDGLFEIHCVGVRCEFDYFFPKQTIKVANVNGKNQKFMSLIDELIVAQNLYPDNKNKINALIFSILAEFNKRYEESLAGEEKDSGEIAYVNRIKRYVISNAHKVIKLSEVAEALHISVSYLCIVFKKITGESLVTYINKYKVNAIKNLIINNNMTLKEASAVVGIRDSAYASRLFKKYENQNLREFKCTTINKP